MKILHFKELGSTQIYLSNALKNGLLVSPICVIADRQTAGIGSRGNTWKEVSEALTFSFALPISSLPIDLPLQSMSIFFGFIFKETLKKFDVWLKWPNDLYIGDFKVGGVMANSHKEDIICGIGLNIKAENFNHLGSEISKTEVLWEFFEKIGKSCEWKEIFSKYALEFSKNFHFSFHLEGEEISLKDAILLPDGGICLHGKKIYSFR